MPFVWKYMTASMKKPPSVIGLQPGEIFTIEPMIRFADDHKGMRIETCC